jgi:hypothetical protein
MGINFVIIIENHSQRSQEEVDEALGVQHFTLRDGSSDEVWSKWECFTHEGHSYASWIFTPRYFNPDDDARWWEGLRKYLVRVREFFGGGAVFLGNDVVCFKTPDDAFHQPFFLPLQLDEELLAEPDLEEHPELRDVKELEVMAW